MSRWQFATTSLLGLVCLILSVTAISSARKTQKLQMELQEQQAEINRGTMSQQIGTNIVRDIAAAAGKNQKLRDLLVRNGFTITENPTASPAPSP